MAAHGHPRATLVHFAALDTAASQIPAYQDWCDKLAEQGVQHVWLDDLCPTPCPLHSSWSCPPSLASVSSMLMIPEAEKVLK